MDFNDFRKELLQNLKDSMEEQEIGSAELAGRLEMDKSYVCAVINGRRDPSMEFLFNAAAKLKSHPNRVFKTKE